MKFSSKEDIEAPIEAVFKEVSDFGVFERLALRRGIRVQRLRGDNDAPADMSWNIEFKFRGKQRQMLAKLDKYDPRHHILLAWVSGGVEGDVVIDLVALSLNRTRLSVAIEFKPKSLSARLLVQSLRLAKNKLDNRYKKRVSQFASDVEDRHKRS